MAISVSTSPDVPMLTASGQLQIKKRDSSSRWWVINVFQNQPARHYHTKKVEIALWLFRNLTKIWYADSILRWKFHVFSTVSPVSISVSLAAACVWAAAQRETPPAQCAPLFHTHDLSRFSCKLVFVMNAPWIWIWFHSEIKPPKWVINKCVYVSR